MFTRNSESLHTVKNQVGGTSPRSEESASAPGDTESAINGDDPGWTAVKVREKRRDKSAVAFLGVCVGVNLTPTRGETKCFRKCDRTKRVLPGR